MGKEQLELYEKTKAAQEQLSQMKVEYWSQYSHLGTWQFWLIFILFFIAPLIILYLTIDRRKMFLLGFYGFNIHVWFGYVDAWGSTQGYWGYPYGIFPFIPGSLSLHAALIPVLFILVYQWTLNHNKNYYVYTLLLAAFLSFIFKPILMLHDFFEVSKGINVFHIFLLYIGVFLFSKLITNVFIWMSEKKKIPFRKPL